MRISDWSSDVCSSDLGDGFVRRWSRHAVAQSACRAPHQHRFRIGVEIRDLPREAIGQADIVLIERGDVATARLGEGEVARLDRPPCLGGRAYGDAMTGTAVAK